MYKKNKQIILLKRQIKTAQNFIKGKNCFAFLLKMLKKLI